MSRKTLNNVKRLPRPEYMVCLFLVIATLVVYWQVQNHDFVSFDDGSYVTENRHVQEGLTTEGIRWVAERKDVLSTFGGMLPCL